MGATHRQPQAVPYAQRAKAGNQHSKKLGATLGFADLSKAIGNEHAAK